nr:gliding motility-associated C-terminal domain-containing protein [Bacteroidales bacterium]
PIALDAGAGFSYNWNTTETTQVINPATTGNYSVIITDANGCTATDDMNLIVNPAPTVDLGADQTHCDYDVPIALDAGAGFSYNWNTTETTQVINPATTGNYSVIITDANGCTATDNMDLIVNPAPTVNLGANQTHCDYNVPIALDAGAGFSYNWNTTETTQVINPATTGNYSVIITDANGCTATDDMDLIVNPAPVVDLGADQTHCDYDMPIALDAGAGFSYNWDSGETTQIINPATTGNYSVIITDANGCTATDNMDLIVNPAPTVNLGADQTHCDYDVPIALDAGAGFSYNWNTTETTQIINPATSGNYSVIITDANGCTATDNMDLIVNPAPTVNLGANQTHCDYDVPIALDAGAGFSYNWSSGETSQIINPATTGNYSVIITDANGCTATDDMDLIVNPAPTIDLGTDQTHCDYDVPIALDAGAGFSYNWSTTEITQIINPATTGNYSVIITDANGCTATDNMDLIVNPEPTVDLGADQTHCDYDVPIALDAGAGFSYNWNTTEISQVINPATTDNYSVIITDANGCTAADNMNLTVNPAPTVNLGADQTHCDYDVPISLDAGAGFSYNWGSGETTQVINPATTGNYSVIITDANGCTATDDMDLIVNPAPTVDLGADQTHCDYDVPIALDAGAGFSYNWGSGETTQVINPATTGNYSVIITDANGCTATDNMNLTVNPAPTVNLGADQTHCDYDVPIALDAGAGFSYNWSSGETTQVINPATTGNYSVIITDVNGCTATDNMDLIVNPAPIFDLGDEISSCEYNFPLTANGPAGMATYLWSTGANTQSIEIYNAGNFNLIVTDLHGCTASSSINYNKLNAPIVELGMNIHACESESPVIINAGNGTSYSWSTGDENQIIAVSNTGDYSVIVTDQHGCTGSDNIFVELDPMPEPGVHSVPDQCINGLEITLSSDYPGGTWSGLGITNPTDGTFEPSLAGIGETTLSYNYSVGMCNATDYLSIIVHDLPPISIMESTRPTCHGFSNGQIEVSSPGTTNPQYIWPDWGSGATLSNIPAGTFTVLVEDDNGCVNTMDIYISEPEPLEGVITKSDVTCPAASDGSASVLASGGTPPYKYLWNTGATDAAIYNLSGGIYTVSVEDINECEIEKSADIYEPPAINFNTNVTAVECGTSHGAINVIASGGNDGFSYQWNHPALNGTSLTDLSAGAYILTATDNNGCTAQTSIIVPAIGNINVSINELNPIECFGYNSGQLEALITNSGGSFDYQWNNGSNNQIISNLHSGNYQVTINDNYGCSGVASHFLNSPDEILINFSTNPVTCHGDGNGITVGNASGGNAPYNYQWNTGHIGDSLENVSGGNYYLSVTDMNNCSATAHTYVHEPATPLSANLLSRDITCYGYNDGKAIVEAYGGTSPYSYEWSTSGLNSNNQEISNLREGFYQLDITDNNGCLFDTMISITEPAPMFIDYTYGSPSCIGNDDGYIEFEVVGGVEPYTFYADIATQNLPYFHGLYEGAYHFTITDGNGCKNQMDKIVLVDNPEECIRIPDAFTPNGDGTNDTWIIENLGMFPNAIVQVFNRWGQEVYFGYANSEPWDGTFEGNHLPTASYIYVVDLHNQSKPKSGTVTIVH